MKLIAILLLFVVATQAISIPNYQYWCTHHFHVFPSTSCYQYHVPFQQCWFTAKYYSSCLKEFPKTSGSGCESEKIDLVKLIKTGEDNLKCMRKDIKKQLICNCKKFEAYIDDVHCQYKVTFKNYLKNVYCETSTTFCDKLKEYECQLNKLKSNALASFKESVEEVLCRIEVFHAKLINKFSDCLKTRKCQIQKYNCKVDEKAEEILQSYANCLQYHITKRENWVETIFNLLYETTSKGESYKTAMKKYKNILSDEKSCLIDTFKSKLCDAVQSIKECYRCNYKCYFNTGCYGFTNKQYRKSLKQLPCAPKYLYKLVAVSAFNPKWKPSPICGLKTCCKNKPETFNSHAYKACVDETSCGYVSDLESKIIEWKKQVSEWKNKISCSLNQKICIIIQTSRKTCLSQTQIQAQQQSLEKQATHWVNTHISNLLHQIDCIAAKYRNIINCWKIQSNNYIDKVQQQFKCCLFDKASKITQYKVHLDDRISCGRSTVQKKLKDLAHRHKCLFDNFFACSFSKCQTEDCIQKLKTDYYAEVDGKVQNVLSQYDAYWCVWKTKLVEHYQCTFKCLPKLSIPLLKVAFKWNFCAPTASCCQFYC